MKAQLCLVLFVVFTFLSCSSAKPKLSAEEQQKNVQLINSALTTKSFQFNAEFAYPLQSNDVIMATNALMRGSQNIGGQINLSGNYDFLKVDGETAEGDLSYFGEMRNVGYNDIADNSIIFSGDYTDFNIDEKSKSDKFIIQFDTNNQVETFRIRMVVFDNLKSNIIVYGSNRTAIRYTGTFEPLTD